MELKPQTVQPIYLSRYISKRATAYITTATILIIGYFLTRETLWTGSRELHTVMEVIATFLALMIGTLSLLRFYSKQDHLFLHLGVGFLGTSFLDGYHAIVTSAYFGPLMPSDLPSLGPWSWVASRQLLSVMLFLSLVYGMREQRLGKKGNVSVATVYWVTSLSTVFCFLFFAFFPLPAAYYPDMFFHRPEEFLPALFFGFTLLGYLYKGAWRTDSFEHWLVLSLIIGFISQAWFMSFSNHLFDYQFDVAHVLKKISYLCVLIGLLISIHKTFHSEIKNITLLAKGNHELMVKRLKAVKLQKAVEGLERSNKELEKFAYVASHDLQEPLRKVQAFGDRLRQSYGDVLDDRGNDYLNRMQNAGKRMSTLINDLLDFSRIATHIRPFIQVDLNDVIQGVLSDLEITIEENNAVVSVSILPTIDADPLQMQQLFQNLIGNAIKYRNPDRAPEIQIIANDLESEENQRFCQIKIKDNGIGFQSEYTSKIFEIFQRLHSRQEYDGTGIGLAIARRIAEQHGGNITATSIPGEGSTFLVTLLYEYKQDEYKHAQK
ncbi:ATP-binding protein [Kiloniella antarctica]|uniref:histidine kinase n=1 Tax=Kiloniella antarctica TaxID=1550907 RepID=A0ABW5BKW6_9PROT